MASFGHFFQKRTSQHTQRSLRVETLENRLLLDAGSASLAGDLFALRQNGPETPFDVLSNDSFDDDYLGERLITSVSYGSEGGRIEIGSEGREILYTPPADFAGTEQFVYAVDGRFTAQVSVSIEAPLEPDDYTIPPDGVTHPLDVLANDPFWPNYEGPRQITAVSVGSAGGIVEIGPDGRTLLYTPADEDGIGWNENGRGGTEETFIYIVDAIYPARVTIDVPETLREDRFEWVQHDPPATLEVLANDPFWPGYSGERRITYLTESQIGATIEIAPDGQSIRYTQPDDFSKGSWDSFRYVVDGVYEAYVSIDLYRPVRDDWLEVDENSSQYYFRVTLNDTYRDRSNVVHDVIDRVTSVTQPESGGLVTISPNGQGILYTPPAGFTGSDSFQYVADGAHEATVRVEVTRPVRDDYFRDTVFQDTPGNLVNVLANDFIGNGYPGPRRITGAGAPESENHGNGATENGGTVTIRDDGRAIFYTPPAGFTGADRFSYTVDGLMEAIATVRVEALAQNDRVEFCPDRAYGTYSVRVLANDNFNRGYLGPGVLTSVELLQGSGQASIAGGSVVLFTPDAAGSYRLRYQVDGQYEAILSISIPEHLNRDQGVTDQNAPARELDVLSNDFRTDPHYVRCKSQDYLGARRITGVGVPSEQGSSQQGPSEKGGMVSIGDNGQTVWYTPPADFYGRDTFTYTVDDFMTETVSVEVIRRVRDDQFRVDSDDGPQVLPVLVNDLFGSNYAGTGQITAVTSTSDGGSVTLAGDGQSIVYTPAAGFIGTDTFTYTVDGTLKAQVSVVVDLDRSDGLPTFESLEAYQQFLVDDALVRYAYLFGTTSWGPEIFSTRTTSFADSSTPQRNYSETNVQVAGVDEGDIVEFDSDYIYMLTDSEVVLLDAWPAEELNTASRIPIEGRPLVEYLNGDRLTVISETGGRRLGGGGPGGGWLGEGPFRPILFEDNPGVSNSLWLDSYWPPMGPPPPSTTIVTVIDVSDRSDPQIVQTTSMEGAYVDSRGVEDQVYLLVDSGNAVGSRPEILDDDGDPDTPGRYETEEEYLARVTANPGQYIEQALPNYTSYGPDGEMVRTGLLNMPQEIHRPIVSSAMNLISVVSVNVKSEEPGLSDTSAVYGTGASTLYASLDNFYVFDRDNSSEDGALTRIVKFDWDPATGGVEFAATTTVAGTILNQFSADEYGDDLRIATTVSNRYSGNWSGKDENMLFVLQEDEGVFERVGSLQNLALDETIQSVRFLGERAFVTTFRTIDPLFAIDLSDPTDPQAVGHITLPGFTTYMQLVDQNYLLTVGRNTPAGTSGPTQVALFDIADLSQPRRIAEYTFSRFSTSEAELDHRAFGYYAEFGLLGLPVTSRYIERIDEDGDGYREARRWIEENRLAVFSVDVGANGPDALLELVGEIEHDTPVRRSGYIGDWLFSVAGDSVKVVAVSDPETVIAELVVVEPEEGDPGDQISLPQPLFTNPAFGIPGSGTLELDYPAVRLEAPVVAAAERVEAYLARLLGLENGAPIRVTAEAVPKSLGGGFSFVFQVGDEFTLIRSSATGWVWRIESGYAFDEGAPVWHAVDTVIPLASESQPGDRDQDADTDGNDFLAWQRSVGATSSAGGDGDSSGSVDRSGLVAWKSNFGRSQAISSITQGDYDLDLDADGSDFLAWQRSLGSSAGATSGATSDGDRSGSVDAGDLAVWEASFGGSMDYLTSVPADTDLDSDTDGGDFLAWQRTFGSESDGPVDSDQSGMVDAGDLAVWEAAFGIDTNGPITQESSSSGDRAFRERPPRASQAILEAFWRHLPQDARHSLGTLAPVMPWEVLYRWSETEADQLGHFDDWAGIHENRERPSLFDSHRFASHSGLRAPHDQHDGKLAEIDWIGWNRAFEELE